MNVKSLDELLNELNKDDRKKFEYLLNFYTVEHVFYNFEYYKHALLDFKPFIYEEFEKPVDEKIKELISKIDLRDVKSCLETYKTNFTTNNRKSVDDLLLYLAMHTSQRIGTLHKMVRGLPKYKRMIEKGFITEDEILFIINSTYNEELVREQDYERVLDISKIDTRITEKILSILNVKVPDNETLFAMKFDLNERDPEQGIYVLSPFVANKIGKDDIREAYKRDGNLVTRDTSILVIKACLGDSFKETDDGVIEKLKAILKNYDLKKITEADLEFLEENAKGDTKDVFYLKNIASDKDALRAFSELPEHLQMQMLNFNILVTKEDARKVLNALDYIKIKQAKEEEKRREEVLEKAESFPNVVRNLFKLPSERIPDVLEILNSNTVNEFKEVVGLDPRITIGIEIEVAGFTPKSLRELLKYRELFSEIRNRRNVSINFTGWKIEEEGSVDYGEGLEVSTPVLKDDKKSWKSVEDACTFLKAIDTYPDEYSGLHVHIGADILGTDEDAWKNLFSLWKDAEEMIYKMGNRANEDLRYGVLDHAGPTAPIIEDLFDKDLIHISSHEDLKKVASEYSRRSLEFMTFSGRTKGMNLQCIAEGKQNTIEFRIPNGELDPVEIQRNVLLFAKIVETAKRLSEDKDYKKDILESFRKESDPRRKIISFLDLLFDDLETKAVFLERYYSREDILYLAGRKYEDVINADIRRDKNEIPMWRGSR